MNSRLEWTRSPASLALIGALWGLAAAGCNTPPASDEGSDSNDSADSNDEADTTTSDDGPEIICMPGETRCDNESTLETCAPTGLEYEKSFCGANEACMPCAEDDPECAGARCVGPCDVDDDTPSSAGCSFYATGMLINSTSGNTNLAVPDAVVLANPNTSGDATVSIYLAPKGSNLEEPVVEPFVLSPGETYAFEFEEGLTDHANDGSGTSKYQSGGVYHFVSDLPVIAYLHTPFEQKATNESSLLLPEDALQKKYVVYNHTPYAEPGYFVVVAVENQTNVKWWPPVETAGNNLPLPFVEAGEMGEYTLNRLDTMRIAASANLDRPECEQDLSGTIIEADKPIMVISGVVGARVPYCGTNDITGCSPDPWPTDAGCINTTDHIQEVNIPLDYWGKTYVGAHSPLRGSENHYWRIFAGEDDATITVSPAQPGTPINLAQRGDYVDLEIPSGVNVVFESDKAFMPVQYLSRHDLADDLGDPAMTQMIPVEQFLPRYAFVTGVNYQTHFVQVIREAGSADVSLDGATVTGYELIGDYEVANVEIPEGSHDILSDDPFGIIQYGWSGGSAPAAYAYPGGLKVEQLFIP